MKTGGDRGDDIGEGDAAGVYRDPWPDDVGLQADDSAALAAGAGGEVTARVGAVGAAHHPPADRRRRYRRAGSGLAGVDAIERLQPRLLLLTGQAEPVRKPTSNFRVGVVLPDTIWEASGRSYRGTGCPAAAPRLHSGRTQTRRAADGVAGLAGRVPRRG